MDTISKTSQIAHSLFGNEAKSTNAFFEVLAPLAYLAMFNINCPLLPNYRHCLIDSDRDAKQIWVVICPYTPH